jgi:hypothetical protein
MDEGTFEQNFTWFEWGFESPGDSPEDRARPEDNGHFAARPLSSVENWDEEHRWPT